MSRSAPTQTHGRIARSVRGSIAPAPRMGAWADFDSSTDDDTPSTNYDALADLFLGDVASKATIECSPLGEFTPEQPAGRNIRRLHGLVIGHLPIMASAWVRQYARHLSEQTSQPCALLRCRDGEAALELIGAAAKGEEATTLEEAIHRAHASAASWVIRVDDASEHFLAASPAIETLTVLTGADEAATVGTYRSIKAIVPQSGSLDTLPPIELVVMGAPPERAQACAERLAKTIETFLGRSIAIGAIIPRISASAQDRVVSLYSGPSESVTGTLEQLEMVLSTEPLTLDDSEETITSDESFKSPPPVEPEPVVSRLGAASNGVSRRHASPQPAPAIHVPHVEEATPASSSAVPLNPRLGSFLDGVRTLGALCPLAENIEIGIDTNGAMHLLASADDDASPQAVVGRLTIVASWAIQHAKLLSVLAEREAASLDLDATPIKHVFTTDARSVRALPDPTARLHLLVPITIASETHWHCTELN